MPSSICVSTGLLVLMLITPGWGLAQVPPMDPVAPFTPRRPETREEQAHREALKRFAQGASAEKEHRLLEAVHLYEEASRLDPEAAAPRKALVPLYLALDRLEDALNQCKQAAELDPADYATWHLYARQLRARQRPAEAARALDRAVASPRLKDHPDLHVQIAFELGALRESLGEYAPAEKAFLVAVSILEAPGLVDMADLNPKEVGLRTAETYERLGKVCVRSEHPNRAITYFVKARAYLQEKEPTRARQLGANLAEVYVAQGEWEHALRAIDDYLETLPQGVEAYRTRIQVLRELGRSNDIIPGLRAHSQRDPHNVGLKLLLAEHVGQNDPETARGLYLEVAKTQPTPAVYKGLIKLSTGARRPNYEPLLALLDQMVRGTPGARDEEEPAEDPDGAAQARAFLSALRESPEAVRGLLTAAQNRMNSGAAPSRVTCYYLGVLAARARELDQAERLFRTVLAQQPPRPRGRGASVDVDVYTNLLTVLQMAHKHESILSLCRQGLEQPRPIVPDYFHGRAADALSYLGRHEEAIKEIDLAIRVSSDDRLMTNRIYKARILGRAGRHDAAIAECEAMLGKYPRVADQRRLRHELSMVCSGARRWERAEEQLRILLQEDPTDAGAMNDLGYYLADQGKQLDEAEALVRKAIELDRNRRNTGLDHAPDSDLENAAYQDSLAWVLFRKGQLAEARKLLEKAAALPEGLDDPVIWDHLGDVCSRQGDEVRAIQAWRNALRLFEEVRSRPQDDHYRDLKDKLKAHDRATR